MKATIKAGTKAWFNTKYNGADVAEFTQNAPVEVKDTNNSWWKTVGPVPGFPDEAPSILVYKDDVVLENQ